MAWIVLAVAALLVLPRAAMATTRTLVQLVDADNGSRVAHVDSAGNLLVASNRTGFTTYDMGTVQVPAQGSVTLPRHGSIGGHLTIFVVGDQPGRVDAYECVPVSGPVQCVIDAAGKAFPGDGALHQTNDDNLQGTEWQVVVVNTGTAIGTYSVTVLDRPLGGPPEKPGV
jgi:hypothetical protein